MTRVRSTVMVVAIAACSAPPNRPAGAPGLAPATEPATTPVSEARAPTSASSTPDSGASTPAARPASSGNVAGVKVTLADVGLEAASLDRSADPCIDFYQFACGGWIQNHPIPADRARFGRGGELDERNKLAIQSVLEEAAKATGGEPAVQQLGTFYASCMDEAAIDRAGTAAFKALLARTQGVKDARSWLRAVAELHKLGIFVVWSSQVFADLRSSTTNVTYLDAAGLTLPDRDYYLKPELEAKLAGYKRHLARLLRLVPPATHPDAAAADVVAIETELARLTKTAVEQRDVPAAYNPTDARALARQVKSVDWPAYWRTRGALPSKKIIVGTPRFFAALDQVRAKFTPAQWASYFTVHLLEAMAVALPRAIDDEVFALQQLVSGVEQKRERSKRCIDLTARALGELLGQPYVARYFPGTSKQDAIKLVDAILGVMRDELARLDWMADATRQRAIAKLGKLVRMIGYPDRWRSYDFDVKRDDFAGNLLRASAFETRRQLAKAGKPVDRSEWQMNAYEVNAYYDPTANTTALPAGILQPPFFGQDRAIAANLGGIGMVIGHELTHAFDDQGAQFDADGNLENWWQQDDLAKFAERGKCVADQYSTFEVLPGKLIQGQLTLGENIADLGGVKMAFLAYRALRKDAVKHYIADGFTEDQQFFLAVGQAWCGRERPAETERRLTVDPHAPPKFRVYGALRNLPDFADAFQCAAGTPMRPARVCSVW